MSDSDILQQNEEGREENPTSEVSIETGHFGVDDQDLVLVSGNICNITFRGPQIRSILKDLNEGNLARHIPSPPPPFVPLQEKVDYWFEYELTTDRQKLFAITLSMFNGLKYPDFRDIYKIVLQVMDIDEVEKEEEKPRSRFDSSDVDLIKQVKAKIKPSDNKLEELLEFEDEKYVTAVFNSVRYHYRGVLLDLLPALGRIVERYRYWDVRYRAALAVAEIGKIGFHRARTQVLEPWARHSRGYVRAAVGYPLARLAEDDVSRQAVEELLDDWIDRRRNNPKEWRYCWTAASTFKHIGIIETNGDDWAINWACQGLKKIAGFDDIRLADSVIHSLVVLSLQGQLERVLLTLKEWMEEGITGKKVEPVSQTRCIVGILAFIILSEVHIELATEEKGAKEAGVEVGNLFELVCQTKKDEYRQLMVILGVCAFEYDLVNAFRNIIVRWSQYDSLLQDLHLLLVDVLAEIRLHQHEPNLNRTSVSGLEPMLDTDSSNVEHGLFSNKSISASVKSIIDAERKDSLERQLIVRYGNLNHLEEQLAQYSQMDAPPHLFNRIDNERAEIQRIEKLLKEIGEQDA